MKKRFSIIGNVRFNEPGDAEEAAQEDGGETPAPVDATEAVPAEEAAAAE